MNTPMKETVKQYAERNDLSEHAVYKRISRGSLETVKKGKTVFIISDVSGSMSSTATTPQSDASKSTSDMSNAMSNDVKNGGQLIETKDKMISTIEGNVNDLRNDKDGLRMQIEEKDRQISKLEDQLEVKDKQIQDFTDITKALVGQRGSNILIADGGIINDEIVEKARKLIPDIDVQIEPETKEVSKTDVQDVCGEVVAKAGKVSETNQSESEPELDFLDYDVQDAGDNKDSKEGIEVRIKDLMRQKKDLGSWRFFKRGKINRELEALRAMRNAI